MSVNTALLGQLNVNAQLNINPQGTPTPPQKAPQPGSSTPTQASAVTSSPNGEATYLSTPYVVPGAVPKPSNTAIAWTTVLAANSGVPAGAVEVICEVYALTDNTNTAGEPQLQVRANASSPVYTAVFLVTSAAGYGSAQASIFRTKCINGNFDYQTTLPGMNNQLRLRVIGYVL